MIHNVIIDVKVESYENKRVITRLFITFGSNILLFTSNVFLLQFRIHALPRRHVFRIVWFFFILKRILGRYQMKNYFLMVVSIITIVGIPRTKKAFARQIPISHLRSRPLHYSFETTFRTQLFTSYFDRSICLQPFSRRVADYCASDDFILLQISLRMQYRSIISIISRMYMGQTRFDIL